MFDAQTIFGTWKAADQDGYDGGFVASDGTNEAWGETPELAKRAFEQHFPDAAKMVNAKAQTPPDSGTKDHE